MSLKKSIAFVSKRNDFNTDDFMINDKEEFVEFELKICIPFLLKDILKIFFKKKEIKQECAENGDGICLIKTHSGEVEITFLCDIEKINKDNFSAIVGSENVVFVSIKNEKEVLLNREEILQLIEGGLQTRYPQYRDVVKNLPIYIKNKENGQFLSHLFDYNELSKSILNDKEHYETGILTSGNDVFDIKFHSMLNKNRARKEFYENNVEYETGEKWYYLEDSNSSDFKEKIQLRLNGNEQVFFVFHLSNFLTGRRRRRKSLPAVFEVFPMNRDITLNNGVRLERCQYLTTDGDIDTCLRIKILDKQWDTTKGCISDIQNISINYGLSPQILSKNEKEILFYTAHYLSNVAAEHQEADVLLFLDLGTSSITATLRGSVRGALRGSVRKRLALKPKVTVLDTIEKDDKQFPSIARIDKVKKGYDYLPVITKKELSSGISANILRNIKNFSRYPSLPITFYENTGKKYKEIPIAGEVILQKIYKNIFDAIDQFPPENVERCYIAKPSSYTSSYEKTIRNFIEDYEGIGLKESQIFFINESDATLLSFLKDKRNVICNKVKEKRNIILAVCDIGAGTFDTTVAKVTLRSTEKIAVEIVNNYSNSFGGNYYDFLIALWIYELSRQGDDEDRKHLMEEEVFRGISREEIKDCNPYEFCKERYEKVDIDKDSLQQKLKVIAESLKKDSNAFWEKKEVGDLLCRSLFNPAEYDGIKMSSRTDERVSLRDLIKQVTVIEVQQYIKDCLVVSELPNDTEIIYLVSGRASLWLPVLQVFIEEGKSDSITVINNSDEMKAKASVINGMFLWHSWKKEKCKIDELPSGIKKDTLCTPPRDRQFYFCTLDLADDCIINSKNVQEKQVFAVESLEQLKTKQPEGVEGALLIFTSFTPVNSVGVHGGSLGKVSDFNIERFIFIEANDTLLKGVKTLEKLESKLYSASEETLKFSHWPRLTMY